MSQKFQSPKSGQICLNLKAQGKEIHAKEAFQSPKSGQICLNLILAKQGLKKQNKEFQSPKSGQICLNQECRP